MNDINRKLYVIKFDNGEYWCGYNSSNKFIRHAIMYTNKDTCRYTAETIMNKRSEFINKKKINSYEIVIIKIDVLGKVE